VNKNLVVRCEGNGEVVIIEIRPDAWRNEFRLAEIVPTSDALVQRRVNHEALAIADYPELEDLFGENWDWDMEAVEALVLGYLNRQSEARVKLHQAWVTELAQA
jgi:hypothetical protein